MVKKRILILLLIIFLSAIIYSDETLIKIIKERDWEKLPPIFLDTSYLALKENFSSFQSITIEKGQYNRLFYKMKLNDQGEMGSIIYNKEDNKYFNLEINNSIKPLYFVEKFEKFRANNINIQVGDAQIHFIKGFFYKAFPFQSLLIFKGKWNFKIYPNDKEEKLTIKRIFKKDHFSKLNTSGIFFLHDSKFLESLKKEGEILKLDSDLIHIYNYFQSLYGAYISYFGQYWYIKFSYETNFIMFNKDKKSYYYYLYNKNNSPDTQLTETEGKQLILSYNSHKKMKITFKRPNEVSELKLNLYLNPEKKSLSGTTTISYKNTHSSNILRLAKGMQLINRPLAGSRDLDIFRRGNSYYFFGARSKNFSFTFKGHIDPDEKDIEFFKFQKEPISNIKTGWLDSFFYLSRTQNFYPNPGVDFVKSDVTISVPNGLNCLASGNLVEKKGGNISTYRFTSPGSKGISLVAGGFKLYKTIKAKIPIKLYASLPFKYPKKINLSDIKKATNLFSKTFGNLDLNEINILLKKDLFEGGISNNGFIIISLPVPKSKIFSTIYRVSNLKNDVVYSPVIIRNQINDHIIHEVAHQWWGGVISWKSYRDVWLTEGLAHFSVLYYLKKKMPEKKFIRIIKNVKRWVYRNKDKGPVIYGTRIHALENNYEAYQSIIYNKSALILLMLMDLIGEKDFIERLRSVLDKFKYKSISSIQFIKQFSKNNKFILNFFENWIFLREIPSIKLELAQDDEAYDNEKMKQIVIYVNQLNTNFVFPLKLKVTTRRGSSVESIIIKKKKQKLIISRNSGIKSITIFDTATLVKEK